MTTAREIMSGSAECVRFGETVTDAARRMRDHDVGALPICGSDDNIGDLVEAIFGAPANN
jgi:CBS-domain-containing membrane protein